MAITADDYGGVWLITVDDDGAQQGGTLVRIDATTNEIAAEIPLGPQIGGTRTT
jgi:hypothetical protein